MSWSTYKTEGIVLRADPVREADRRYRILTPEHGKIEVLGRGARKGKAKLAAHLEPFAVVELEVVRGRQQSTVIGVERKEWFTNIHRSLEARLLAQATLNFVDRCTREFDQDAYLYSELLGFLNFLNSVEVVKPLRGTYVAGGFLLRLMSHIGYELELDSCLTCREEIMPLSFRWHRARGGLVCTTCISQKEGEFEAAKPMREETVKLLRFARQSSYADLMRPPLISSDLEEFAACVHDMMAIHIPGDLEVPFWKAVLQESVVQS